MKIAIVSEGIAEYHSIPLVLRRCSHITNSILDPLKCDFHPNATYAHIAKVIIKKTQGKLIRESVDLLVVLIDREKRQDSCCFIASNLKSELLDQTRANGLQISVEVVVKDRMFEDWLISDVSALDFHPIRFPDRLKIRSLVEPNKSDSTDGLTTIKLALGKNHYEKIRDAKLICSNINIQTAGKNSRSLRKLLRVLEIQEYRNQSKNP